MTEVRCPFGQKLSVFSRVLRDSHLFSHAQFFQYDTFRDQIDKFCQSTLVSIFPVKPPVRRRNSPFGTLTYADLASAYFLFPATMGTKKRYPVY